LLLFDRGRVSVDRQVIQRRSLCAAPDLIAQGYVKRIADRTFIITDKPWRDD